MNEVEQPEFNYEIDYAHSYFRTEIPIAICPHCGVVDGVFERTSTDGMGGGYGTALFSHEHPLVFLILEEEDRHLAGPRSYYIDGEPPANILKLLKKPDGCGKAAGDVLLWKNS